MLTRSIATLFILALCSFEAIGAMYRDVDESGRTVYSQHPPSSGQAEVIKPPPPPRSQPESKTADATGVTAKTAEPNKGTEGEADKAEAGRRAMSDKIKAENCERSRKMLDMYNNPQNRLVKTPDGLYERVTDEKRAQGIEAANKNIKEFCN